MAETENAIYTPVTICVDSAMPNKQMIYAKQNDAKSRYIVVTLVSDEGKVDVSGIAQLNAMKPDGTLYYSAGTINEDGTITIELTSQLLAAPGRVFCDVSIIKGPLPDAVLLTSATFFLIVERSNYDPNAIESSDCYDTITESLLRAEQAAAEAIESAASAEDSLDDAIRAKNAAIEAQIIAVNAAAQVTQFVDELNYLSGRVEAIDAWSNGVVFVRGLTAAEIAGGIEP